MKGIPVIYRDGQFIPEAPVEVPEGKRWEVVEAREEIEIPDFQFRETPDDVHDPEEVQRMIAILSELQSIPKAEGETPLSKYLQEQKRLNKEAIGKLWGLDS